MKQPRSHPSGHRNYRRSLLRCDLTEADLLGRKLKSADLRESTIDGIRVGARELEGAIIDPLQAVEVATLLGLTVKEIGDA